MIDGARQRRSSALAFLRGVPVAVVMLVPVASSFDGTGVDAVVSQASTCPVGVGVGGQPAATSGATLGGDGCVVFEHSGQYSTFTYTGADQTWTVPSGVTSVVIRAIGAGGGGGRSGQATQGGGGGYATGRMNVTAGQQFTVIVGGGGRRHCSTDVPLLSDTTGRHNFSYGGGAAGNGTSGFDCAFASGGGRSAVRVLGATDDLITAGGGGGGGYNTAGGAGGGTSGLPGVGAQGGGGGTQSAGGVSPTPEVGVDGIRYAGGWAGYSATDRNAPSEGGGGGGGYYGGGAGGDNGGGGGGSSWLGTLSDASTVAGSGANAGIAAPSNSSLPTVPSTGVIGASMTGTPGTWSHAASGTYKWQHSTDGTSFTDVAGATGLTFTPSEPGYVRMVETRSNLLGSTSVNSASASVPDTRLSALAVSTGELSPAFASSRTSYAIAVGYRTRTIRITPTASSGSASIRVGAAAVVSGSASQQVDLSVGSNQIVVRVEVGGAATETIIDVARAAATAPAAPTISAVDEGDAKLVVSFDGPADDGGEAVDRYEYSIDGTTWVNVDRASTTFEITGLANGTEYEVRVRAVNVVGFGAQSAVKTGRPRAAVTPAIASTTPPTSTPTSTTVPVSTTSVATSTTVQRKQSRAVPTSATTPTRTTVVTTEPPATTEPPTTVASSSTSIVPTTMPESSTSTTIEDDVVSTTVPAMSTATEPRFELIPEFGVGAPVAGALVRATAVGLLPGSEVRLEVHSQPTLVASGVTDASGDATLSGALPTGLAPGSHMLSLAGTAVSGESLFSVVAFAVDADGTASSIVPGGGVLSALPDSAQVARAVATGSTPYDASRDASGAVALAGAAVVLLGLAGAGSSKSSGAAEPTESDTDGDAPTAADEQRDETSEGSLASAEAKILNTEGTAAEAWGDRSVLWALPGWGALRALLTACMRRTERWSTLVVRVLQDGTWCRAAFGSGAVLPWLVGAAVGFAAARSVDGLAVPPAFGFIVAIVVVSFIDALAGAFGWLAFTLIVAASGGLRSWFDLRTVLGLAVLFVALPLIAASFRPLVRGIAGSTDSIATRLFDFLAAPLFLSYAAASAYKALNGLSGLDVVATTEASSLRWLCLALVFGRMLAEEATVRWFPARRAAAALSVGHAQLRVVSYVNIALLLGVYALTAGPYMGTGARTWLIMGLMCVVPLLKTRKERLPNARFIHRWLPRGILRSVVMLYVMAYYGRWLLDVTGADTKQIVPLMLLPGIVIGVSDCFGRTGGGWPESRWKNAAGAVLWVVSFSVVAGWLTP